MRRMQDDERRLLRSLLDRKPFSMSFDRAEVILKTFRYHGLVDAKEELTTRGKHVAAKLPAIPETEPIPAEVVEPIEFTDEKEWD